MGRLCKMKKMEVKKAPPVQKDFWTQPNYEKKIYKTRG